MIGRLLCYLGKHDYYIAKAFSLTTRKVACGRCPKAWGMHDVVKAFVPWDGELEALHAETDQDDK